MIQLSSTAVAEINRLKTYKADTNSLLRLIVKPGGCSTYYYSFEFTDARSSDDQTFVCDDLQIVLDPKTLNLIAGIKIDYSEDLMGGGFRFHNPNASQTCGCGNSFSI